MTSRSWTKFSVLGPLGGGTREGGRCAASFATEGSLVQLLRVCVRSASWICRELSRPSPLVPRLSSLVRLSSRCLCLSHGPTHTHTQSRIHTSFQLNRSRSYRTLLWLPAGRRSSMPRGQCVSGILRCESLETDEFVIGRPWQQWPIQGDGNVGTWKVASRPPRLR